MPRRPHPPWFNHSNNTRWRIQAMKFIIMQFSPWSVFIPFSSKYPPQHTVLKDLSLSSSLKVKDQVSQPHSKTRKIILLYILIFSFLYEKRKQKIMDWMIASILRI
jgi:hypothetical protein